MKFGLADRLIVICGGVIGPSHLELAYFSRPIVLTEKNTQCIGQFWNACSTPLIVASCIEECIKVDRSLVIKNTN